MKSKAVAAPNGHPKILLPNDIVFVCIIVRNNKKKAQDCVGYLPERLGEGLT